MTNSYQSKDQLAKRQTIIVVILTLIMIALINKLTSGDESSTSNKTQASNIKYVKTVRVKNGETPIRIESFGRVMSERSIVVSSEVQGKLQNGSIELKPGASFTKGQVIAKIYDTDIKLALNARRANFINLMASAMADIRIDYPEKYEKWNTFFESIDVESELPGLPSELGTKEKTFLATKNVLTEYYGIKSDEEKLRKYSISAPFSGSISAVQIEVGSNVNPGNPICTLIENNALEVQIPVSIDDIQLVNTSSQVHLIHQKDTLKASVHRISSHVNPNTQTIDVYAKIINKSFHIYDGMYFDVLINSGTAQNVFSLSRRALVDDNHVYVLSDSALSLQQIDVMKTNMNDVIVENLTDGIYIVNEPITLVSTSYKYVALDQNGDE